jgi:O-antigen biosynthesis protein
LTESEADNSRQGQAQDSLLYGAFFDYPIVSGFIFDKADLTKRWVVELCVDGWPVDVVRADRFDFRMPNSEANSKDFGFVFDIERFDVDTNAVVEIRLANADQILARLSDLKMATESKPPVPGAAEWIGGLRFAGWVARETDVRHTVRALIDDDIVAECSTHGLTLVEDGASSHARPAFDLHLPREYADGRARILDIVDEDGHTLSGCPISFIAYNHNLADAVAERAQIPPGAMRTALLRRIISNSVPFSNVKDWSAEFFPPPARAITRPIAIVLVGDEDVETSLESLANTQGEWLLASLPSEKRDGCFHDSDLVEFLDQNASGYDYLVFALAGTRFSAGALQRLAAALDAAPSADFAYCDIFVEAADGTTIPVGFPAFDYERFLEQAYPAWCFIARVEKIRSLTANGTDSLIGLFSRGLGENLTPESAPRHVPGFLATLPSIDIDAAAVALREALTIHLRSRRQRAKLERREGSLFPAVLLRRLVSADTVTVVVAVHNESERVRSCLAQLSSLPERHRLDIIIVDLASTEPALLRYIDRVNKARVRRIRVDGALNLARALNRGAELARNRHILFLDPAVTLGQETIDELMSRCAEPDVAGAGSLVLSSEGLVISAGLILEHERGATAACFGWGEGDDGYGDLLLAAHERSALSPACMLVKRQDHMDAGGFDEITFPREFFTVDYCLRLRARGRRFVMSPHCNCVIGSGARSAPRGGERIESEAALKREIDLLRLRWGHVLDQDPCYSPLLSLDGAPFSALAFPPRTDDLMSPRSATIETAIKSTEVRVAVVEPQVVADNENSINMDAGDQESSPTQRTARA